MFKKVFIVLSITSILLRGNNYIDLYRENGINKVKNLFDSLLKSEKYWNNYLKNYNTTFGYYEKEKYIVISSKADKTMDIFQVKKGNVKKVFSSDVLLGKDGEKKKEGDLTTPIGAYKIVSKFKPQDNFYGPMAFALSYPNLYDKLHGKNGHGIWIHGYPTNNKARPDITKGCLVLKNKKLEKLGKIIKPKNTYVIIGEYKLKKVNKKDIAKILSFLYSWKDSWGKNDIKKYLSFYSKNFKRFDGKNFTLFSKMKKRIFARKNKKSIIFKNISIIPYPTINGKKLFRVDFYEKYSAKNYIYNGNKQLYIELVNSVKILAEK